MSETLEGKRKKVAIIGCADSKSSAPFGDPAWDCWGVNNLYVTIPPEKFSRWFEIHYIHQADDGKFLRRFSDNFRGKPVGDYLKDLAALKIPVMMQRLWPEVPNGVLYPLDKVLRTFSAVNGWLNRHPIDDGGDIDLSNPSIIKWSASGGLAHEPRVISKGYLTNSISYMLALAIVEGYEEIGVWGVDMAVSSELRGKNEYSWQRPSCEFFLGWAAGMGVKVYIPPTADLLKCRNLYGFEEPQAADWAKKTDEMVATMQQRQAQAEAELNNFSTTSSRLAGAIEALERIKKHIQDGMAGPELTAQLDRYIQGNGKAKQQHDLQGKIARKKYDQYTGAIECAREEKKIWG